MIYARKGHICCCVPGWDWLLGGRVWVSGTKTNSRKKASHVWGAVGNLSFAFSFSSCRERKLLRWMWRISWWLGQWWSLLLTASLPWYRTHRLGVPVPLTHPRHLSVWLFHSYFISVGHSQVMIPPPTQCMGAILAAKVSATMRGLLGRPVHLAPHAGKTDTSTRPPGMDVWAAPLPSDPFSWLFQPICYLNPTGRSLTKCPNHWERTCKSITPKNQFSSQDPWAWLKL